MKAQTKFTVNEQTKVSTDYYQLCVYIVYTLYLPIAEAKTTASFCINLRVEWCRMLPIWSKF